MNHDPVVMITGASTGIGLALAKRLASKSYRVALTAREDSLPRFAKAGIVENDKVSLYPLDIVNPDQRHLVIERINRKWGGVDILINNAGISYRSVVEHMGDDEEIQQMSVNYLAAMALIRLVLPHMRAQRSGRIINVSSVSGMMAMPTMASYSASKFALEGASEALWYEMLPWNIRVSIVEPGFIHSNSFEHVYYSRHANECLEGRDDYVEYYKSMAPFVRKMMNAAIATSDDVAKTILRVMQTKNPSLRVPATIDARFFYWLRRLIPRWMYHKLLYKGLPGANKWAPK